MTFTRTRILLIVAVVVVAVIVLSVILGAWTPIQDSEIGPPQ